jgi:PKD repeat protein
VGTYQVRLVVTNVFGQDSIVNAQAVVVSPGNNLAIVENFVTGVPPVNWTRINPDNNITWVQSNGPVVGPSGQIENVAMMDFYNYQARGQVDFLVTPTINLLGVANPILTFDVAYARYNAGTNDALEIEISTNCGSTYDSIIYRKDGSTLATVTDRTTVYIPNSSAQWRRDTVQLSGFSVSDVRLRFKAINDYGNNLYLTNVNIIDPSVTAPTGTIVPPSAICANEPVVFSGIYTNNPNDITWSFGGSAIPASATGPGPHSVVYSNSGSRRVELTVKNAGGQNIVSQVITIDPSPLAAFSQNIAGNTVTFNNQSLGNPTAFFWDFGDGNTSNVSSPTHTYATGGVFQVSLAIETPCGPDTLLRQVSFTNIAVETPNAIGDLIVSPNPTTGLLSVSMEQPINAQLQLQITDLAGRMIMQKEVNLYQAGGTEKLDLSALAKGNYLLTVLQDEHFRVLKIIIQ